jgi:hypothetical protein
MKFYVKRSAEKLAAGGKKLKDGAVESVRAVDRQHEKIADHADSVAKATKVAAGVAVAGAVVAAPTGLTAFGVALGVLSAPVIVTAAPILASAAGIAVTVSAGASLYSKIRRKQSKKESSENERA